MDDSLPDDEGSDELGEDIQAVLDYEAQQRLWLRALTGLLEKRSHDSDPSARVQLAFDQAMVAACERIGRICRSDLPADLR